MFIVLAMLVGFAASFVSGLLGGGAGLITVPGLYWLLAHNYPEAPHLMQITIATGTLTAVPLGMMATWRQWHYKNIDIAMLKQMIGSIVLGALLGAVIVDHLDSHVLKYIYSTCILLMALWMSRYRIDGSVPLKLSRVMQQVSGLLIGCISGLLGVSVFTVPFLMKLGVDIRRSVGTSTVIVFAYSCVMSIGFIILGLDETGLPPDNIGYVNLTILFSAVIPSMIGSALAVKVVNNIPREILKKAFVSLMVIVGAVMLVPR